MGTSLRTLEGRAYAPFEPDRLANLALDADIVREFTTFDEQLAAGPDWALHEPGLASLILGGAIDRANQTTRAILATKGLVDNGFDAKELARANACLRGRRKSAYRTGAQWIGAGHPADAWYVAPSSEAVPGLMSDLVRFLALGGQPVTLKALVSFVQFVLIHPFDDGNGRTARSLFVAVLARTLGTKAGCLVALSSVLEFKSMRLHAAQLRLRDQGDWGGVLRVGANAFAAATRADTTVKPT